MSLMSDMICRNCIYSVKQHSELFCVVSPPPRNRAPVAPVDVCSKGCWAVRKRVGEFMYDEPSFMGYLQILKAVYDPSCDDTDLVIVSRVRGE